MTTQHIILIGFKNVGKTRIAKMLAQDLGLPYADLDAEIEQKYSDTHHKKLSCRQIMTAHGEPFFRALEHDVLQRILTTPTKMVIALGGGAVLRKDHHALLRKHVLIHVVAPQALVYERIMVNGRPTFFGQEENSYDAFERLWDERKPVYESLATLTLDNGSSVEDAVEKIKLCLATRTI